MSHSHQSRVPDLILAAKQAKRDGNIAAAERLFLEAVNITEAESHTHGGVAPACYEGLAILYSQRHDYAGEVTILKRFARQRHAPGVMPAKLLERLEKAEAKLAGTKTTHTPTAHRNNPPLPQTSPRAGQVQPVARPITPAKSQPASAKRTAGLLSLKGIIGAVIGVCVLLSCILGRTPSSRSTTASAQADTPMPVATQRIIAASGPTRAPFAYHPTLTPEQPTATSVSTEDVAPINTEEPTATAIPLPAEGHVTTTANMRTTPRVDPSTVAARFCEGDGVRHVDTEVVGTEIWYRVTVVEAVECNEPQHVHVGSEGWVSGGLVAGMENYAEKVAYLIPTATAKPQPVRITKPAPVAPSGGRVGAVCRDGTRSSATGRGACSHHGGVDHWLYGP